MGDVGICWPIFSGIIFEIVRRQKGGFL